uniref:Uncharacterized protein n=1 Tax=Anguilla anguilla TaxID=7936 RepID=A0A0E9RWJ6_ANGAN
MSTFLLFSRIIKKFTLLKKYVICHNLLSSGIWEYHSIACGKHA